METKVQKQTNSTNLFKEKDFRQALEIANNLEFNDFEVDENTKANNWFGLFLDDSNAYWTIHMTSAGNYALFVEDVKIGLIGKELETKLDSFREDQLSSDERSVLSLHEYRMEQIELWDNYGYGKL